MIDGLDTAMLMGLDKEVSRAKKHIAKLDFSKGPGNLNPDGWDASFFEATIRYVGGLLGAHTLSKDSVYLDKALDIGKRLSKSFDAQISGLPVSVVNLQTGSAHNHDWNSRASVLSEVGSSQLEYFYLSKQVGDHALYDKSRHVFTILKALKKPIDGLYPVYIQSDSTGGVSFSSQRLAIGSLADSFYEYLLKLYILSKGKDQASLEMYLDSVEGIVKNLVRVVTWRGKDYAFVGEMEDSHFINKQEHLSCFFGGLLALGASVFPSDIDTSSLSPIEIRLHTQAPAHLKLAKQLADGCLLSYQTTSTGLGPESFEFVVNPTDSSPLIHVEKPSYLLRPETLETLFILFRVTKDPAYREAAYGIFQAFLKFCKTQSAFSGLKDVNPDQAGPTKANWNNSMQSFFLAETLKYLFLLFGPADVLPLNEFVFTTEAHVLPIQ
eukprot:gb/GEZN01007394.1/.p1 GENE.gb/GEZN01007394.1/~~gb/GEZN01007394.1/.p1  ORF type:complete len:492 (+),score=28.88 gb/GEZN01007394.1/:164-1477(+)